MRNIIKQLTIIDLQMFLISCVRIKKIQMAIICQKSVEISSVGSRAMLCVEGGLAGCHRDTYFKRVQTYPQFRIIHPEDSKIKKSSNYGFSAIEQLSRSFGRFLKISFKALKSIYGFSSFVADLVR